MKLSTKYLVGLLGILVIIFAVLQFTKRDNRSRSIRSELVNIDTADVTKLEIISAKGTVLLEKENGEWTVALASGRKSTKENVVGSLLTNLNTIKPGRLASRKRERWQDYAVDSTGTRVKVYQGDKVDTDIVLGRFGMEGQRSFYTFVRLYEDEDVYVANDFMKMSIYENADDYRDNMIFRLNKDSLTSVAFTYPDSSFALVKNGAWQIGTEAADSASVAQYFQGLNYLSSKNFADEQATPTLYEVVFSFSDQPDVSIQGFETPGGLVIGSSENKNEAFRDDEVVKKVFKGSGSFLK